MSINDGAVYIDLGHVDLDLLRVGSFNVVYDRWEMDEGEQYSDEDMQWLVRYIDYFKVGGYARVDGTLYEVLDINREDDIVLLKNAEEWSLINNWYELNTRKSIVPLFDISEGMRVRYRPNDVYIFTNDYKYGFIQEDDCTVTPWTDVEVSAWNGDIHSEFNTMIPAGFIDWYEINQVVKLGDWVRVKHDTYPGQGWEGVVVEINDFKGEGDMIEIADIQPPYTSHTVDIVDIEVIDRPLTIIEASTLLIHGVIDNFVYDTETYDIENYWGHTVIERREDNKSITDIYHLHTMLSEEVDRINAPVKMSKSELEAELGYKVEIIDEEI